MSRRRRRSSAILPITHPLNSHNQVSSESMSYGPQLKGRTTTIAKAANAFVTWLREESHVNNTCSQYRTLFATTSPAFSAPSSPPPPPSPRGNCGSAGGVCLSTPSLRYGLHVPPLRVNGNKVLAILQGTQNTTHICAMRHPPSAPPQIVLSQGAHY